MNLPVSGYRLRTSALLLILALCLGTMPVRAEGPEDGPVIGEAVTSNTPASPAGYLPTFTGCTRVNVPVQNADYEQRVVELVNQERAAVSLPPLKRQTDLDYAARYHAKDMHDENYVAHNSYDGSTVVCDWSTRVSNFYSGWYWLGENIAAGYTTPESVMVGWMGSPGHRDNILSENYREIGVGYYYGPNGYHSYWVQDFGARGEVYPLIINNDDAETNTPNVSLYIYGPNSSGTEMRLRNDGGDWGAWQPYTARLNWTLTSTNGTRTVYVELRSGGNTYSSNDTIQAVNLAPTLGNLPDSVSFIYDQQTARLIPSQVTLQPLNTGSADTLTWQAVAANGWISPQSGSGSTPNGTFSFAPSGSVLQTRGNYDTTVTVTVTNPSGTQGSPKVIQVHLHVTALDHSLFLSTISR